MKKPLITVKHLARRCVQLHSVLLVRTALHPHAGTLDPINGAQIIQPLA
jgi:hypothetical protein